MRSEQGQGREIGAKLHRLEGLPPLSDRSAVAQLLDDGSLLAIGDGSSVALYDVASADADASGEVLCRGEHKLDGRVTAIGGLSRGRFAVATDDGDGGGRLHVVDGDGIGALASFDAPIADVEGAGNGVVVALRETQRATATLVALDGTSGRQLWTRSIPAGATRVTPVARAAEVLVAQPKAGRVTRVPLDPGRGRPRKPKRPCDCGDERRPEEGKDRPEDGKKPGDDRPPRDDDDERPGGTGVGDDCHDWVADGRYVAKHSRCREEPPCKTRLDFHVARLALAARHVIAQDLTGRRVALLDRTTLRVHEVRSLGRGGALVATAPDSNRMLAFRWGSRDWTLLDLGELLDHLPPLDLDPVDPPADSITYHGHNPDGFPTPGTPQTGTKRVLAVPVIEPGQSFTDPDLGNFVAFMRPNSFDIVTEYYDENSFGELDLQTDFFGHDIFPGGGPLSLPRAIRSYYHPPFVAGGIEATEVIASPPAAVRLDGTESLSVHIDPIERSEADLTFPFCALGLSKTYDEFPVDLVFNGSETAELEVEDRSGTVHTLTLQFPAQTITIEAGDIGAGLAALETYLDSALGDAQANAGVPPGSPVLTPVEARRVQLDDVDFGSLDVNIGVDPGTGAGKGRVEMVTQNGLELIGMDAPISGAFTLPGDAGALESYLGRVVRQAEADAGFGADQERRLTDPEVTWDGTSTLTIRIRLSDSDGGDGASMTLSGTSGLEALGLDTPAEIPGSGDFNDRNTLRDSQELVNDVFTAMVNQMGGIVLPGVFDDYFSVLICFVGAPPAGEWGASQPDIADLRMFTRNRAATYAFNPSLQLDRPWTGTVLDADPDTPTTIHELGHAFRLPDLYSADGFRDDLLYMGGWSIMGGADNLPHFCGWGKLFLGFIPPARVVEVELPTSAGPTITEALLVPVEHWDDDMENAVRAEFGGSIPIGQLMSIDLGGDGFQFDLVEARQAGVQFSQSLPDGPGLLLTNALDPGDDERYAKNDLYRRKLHRLNSGSDLESAGDAFDLAAAPELPAVGVTVSVVEARDVMRPHGAVRVFHTRVEREQADFVDLFFTAGSERFRCPDVWVDWIGDNPSDDEADHRVFPEGTPEDQGEPVFVPMSGTEPHWVVARVQNRGTASALNVKVVAYRWDPAGAGDRGDKVEFGSKTIDEVPAGQSRTVPFRWDVGAGEGLHRCLQCEIADWELPDDPATAMALASDDTWISNNWGQKNVFDFVPKFFSPADPVEFDYSVNNDGVGPEVAYLKPEGLPPGAKLTVTPTQRTIRPGETAIFRCVLEIDEQVIQAGCRNDRKFVLWTWRETDHAFERWGGCEYTIAPRTGVTMKLSARWTHSDTIYARGSLSPSPGGGTVDVRIAFDGGPIRWVTAAIQPGGSFAWEGSGEGFTHADVTAHYRGSTQFSPADSPLVKIDRPPPPA